jgi:hypothetical protein
MLLHRSSAAPPAPASTAAAAAVPTVPAHLQPAFAALSALHSAIDSGLAELESALTIADITARTGGIKQQIAELELRIARLQATLSADGSASSPSPSPSSPSSPSALLAQHAAVAASYPNQLRQRILASRAGLAQRASRARLQLLSSSSSSLSRASASVDTRRQQFSASLSHTQELMAASLSLSSASLQSLESSTGSLRSASRQSAAYSAVLRGGSKVITKQQQRQRTDRLLLCVALLFFATVCLYIINKRMRISRLLSSIWHIASSLQPQPHHSSAGQP